MLSDDLGGEEQNPFTGLQYLRARYYAPQNGGFITQDSFAGILTNALSQNRYTYAENDPVNGIDPSGHAKAPGGATKGGGTSKTGGQSSQSGRMSASTGRTSSSAKPTYTAPPARPSSTSSSSRRPMTMDHLPTSSRMPAYASGAASAALSARLGSAASHPSAELTGRLMSSAHQPMRKSSSSLPVVIENFVEGAKSFIRKTCDATTQYYERQAENKRIESLGRQAIGKAFANGWNSLTAANYREYEAQRNQMEQNSLAQLLLLEDMWNSAAQAAYVNQVLSERNRVNSLKSTVAMLRPWTESMKEWSEEQSGTLQLGANAGGSGGMSSSVEAGFAMDLQGNIGVYGTIGTGYDFSTLSYGPFPPTERIQWNPVDNPASFSNTIALTVTNAKSLEDLSGAGISFGLSATDTSGTTYGVAYVATAKDKNGNVYDGISVSYGKGTMPGADLNVMETYTVIGYFNIYDALLEYYAIVEGMTTP